MFTCNIFKNERKKNLEDTVLSSLPVTWGTIKGSNTKQGSCVLIS